MNSSLAARLRTLLLDLEEILASVEEAEIRASQAGDVQATNIQPRSTPDDMAEFKRLMLIDMQNGMTFRKIALKYRVTTDYVRKVKAGSAAKNRTPRRPKSKP